MDRFLFAYVFPLSPTLLLSDLTIYVSNTTGVFREAGLLTLRELLGSLPFCDVSVLLIFSVFSVLCFLWFVCLRFVPCVPKCYPLPEIRDNWLICISKMATPGVCDLHMIYTEDIIPNYMHAIFWAWKWYIESNWIKWNKNSWKHSKYSKFLDLDKLIWILTEENQQ